MFKTRFNYFIAASFFAAAPALADTANVSIYGVADVSYDSFKTGNSTAGIQGTTINKVSSNASRIGFKGAEEMGAGFTANWQIESLVALDNAGGTFATRNSFAAVTNKSYGTLLLGRYDTPFKIITRKLDNFADSIADNRSLFGTVSGVSASKSFVTKQPDVLSYTSPNFDGFVASIARVNLAETTVIKASDKTASATSLSAAYDNGTLYGALGYELHKLDTVRVGGEEKAWNVALAYKVEDYALALAYEKTGDTLGGAAAPTACAALAAGADCMGHSALYVTGKYLFDANALKIAYTRTGNLGAAANTGATQLSLGYDHRTSKRTTLYVLYTKLSNDSNANYGLGNASFASAATASIGAGADPSALSLGMKHVF
ncbi:MAG: porin [Sideroxydans sp.]|nr:porin [Sideroxydans sp.]